MTKFWRLLGEMVETGTSFAPVAGAAAPSPYIPDIDATLIGIRIITGRQAASSLTNDFQITMVSTTFIPNEIHAGSCGSGLQTAPAILPNQMDFEIFQPVKSGVKININGRNLYANCVTPDNMIFGLFQVG